MSKKEISTKEKEAALRFMTLPVISDLAGVYVGQYPENLKKFVKGYLLNVETGIGVICRDLAEAGALNAISEVVTRAAELIVGEISEKKKNKIMAKIEAAYCVARPVAGNVDAGTKDKAKNNTKDDYEAVLGAAIGSQI